jgi:hypothetical protein
VTFIQIIEVVTARADEIRALTEEWAAKTEGRRRTRGATLTADRDRPNTYLQIVEFPSYEEAMENSSLPETGEFGRRLQALCDAPPNFRNLEVRHIYDL